MEKPSDVRAGIIRTKKPIFSIALGIAQGESHQQLSHLLSFLLDLVINLV
jgi:hypothetical protein